MNKGSIQSAIRQTNRSTEKAAALLAALKVIAEDAAKGVSAETLGSIAMNAIQEANK